MLKMLLEEADLYTKNSRHKSPFKAMVFSDDTHKHILDIYSSFCSSNIEMNLSHYTDEKENVDACRRDAKVDLREKWRNLLDVLKHF